MKLFDKLKNALFEEEYVEVEEKPKKKEVKKEVKKDKPIAKKIELPKRDEKPIIVETPKEEPVSDRELLQPEKNFRFPLELDDDDFVEQPIMDQKQPSKPKEEVKPLPPKREEKRHDNLYHVEQPSFHETSKPLYEKKEEKKVFRPSPVISPVYGVLDKNYRKEEIVSKRDATSRSSYASNHLDLDAVRNKAYGDLTNDMGLAMTEEEKRQEEDQKIFDEVAKPAEESLLVDMRDDDTTPAVDKVTVGDAEEYFNDLGLQYNVDYKDASKERATGRRVNLHHDEVEEKPQEEKEETQDVSSDDNLFDLIDSMYEEKEKGE